MIAGLAERDLVLHRVRVAGRAIELRAPRDATALPSDDRDERPAAERRTPFWARLWPGSVALAERLLGPLAGEVRGRRAVELGAGLGLAGIAAALAGARVVLTDASPLALEVALANARANGVADARALALEWTGAPPRELEGGFDVAVAAEVLYDPRHVGPFAASVRALLAPGGRALVADPERLGAGALESAARAAGLGLERIERAPHPRDVACVDGAGPREIAIYRLTVT